VAEAAFGVELRRSRQAAALSLRQLAVQVGYDHSYLSQVERGQRPGSPHLAELCDRALGTGSALAAAYERAHPVLVPAAALAAGTSTLEATRHGLAGSFGQVPATDEWAAVIATYSRDFATTAPADLLPELSADLDLLRAAAGSQAPAALAVPAAELAMLMALTLAGLGKGRAAWRWWRTAQHAADSSGDAAIRSLARSLEAIHGLYERRPRPELLEIADQALALADRPDRTARALAARAQVLAVAGRAEEARLALRESVAVTAALSAEVLGDTSLFGWPAYRVHCVGSFVFTAVGDTAAAYEAQDRGFDLCPAEYLRDRAELQLQRAHCLVQDGEVAAGLATAMRVLVELPDQWHTEFLYAAAGRVLSVVPAVDLGRPAVRDYRELLARRPYQQRC
jgi:transcriptional regulator with XRE-family HTH domain